MNNLNIVGRIGKVGELRYTASGKPVINFSVATDNGKDRDGNKRKPTWFEVTLWDKQAEGLAKYLRVGDRIGVFGKANIKVDESRDGKSYPKLVVEFSQVELMGGSQQTEQATIARPPENRPATQNRSAVHRPAAQHTAAPPAEPEYPAEPEIGDEDISF